MIAGPSRSRFLVRSLPLAVCAVFAAYFGFHAAYGERGLQSLNDLRSKAETRESELADLKQQEASLRRRVALIKGPDIDGDILEEEVRALLGWTTPNEIVILEPRTAGAVR